MNSVKDLLSKRQSGTQQIVKAKVTAHQVGEPHPDNPNILWTDIGNGNGDWKSKNGKWWKGKNPATVQTPSGGAKKQETKQSTSATAAAKEAPASDKKLEDMSPSELVDYAKKATTDALAKVVNDKNADKGLRQLAFNELKTRSDYDKTKVSSSDLAGGYVAKPTPKIQYKTKKPEVELPDLEDYEAPDAQGIRHPQSIAKLRSVYAKKTDDEVLSTLNNKKAKYQLRQIAYDEAAARGIPEDKINVSGTLQQNWKKAKENKDIEDKQNKPFNQDEAISLTYDWKGFDHKKCLDEEFDGGLDTSFLNPDSDKVKRVFKTDTLSGRQLYDTFKDYYQRDPSINPGYLNAQNKVNDLNGRMCNWAKADKNVMFVSAGGAGAGKTYGWQKIVAPYLSLPQLDSVNGDPTSKDWGWVMLQDSDCDTPEKLRDTLHKYNGKWIDSNGHERPHILFFDDADKILTSKSATMMNLMKNLCDTNAKNRLFDAPGGGKELWEGKIIVTTNKDLGKLSANPDFAAVQSRIATNDIQFTRNETMELLADRYMDMTLNDAATEVFAEQGFTDDEIEDFRQDVFDYMQDNMKNADPRKFTPRLFLNLCDYIAPQWKNGQQVIRTGTGQMGVDIHWRKTALSLFKAENNDIEKAGVDEFYSRDAMLERKKELEKMMNDDKYKDLFTKEAQNAIIFGEVSDKDEKDEKKEKRGKKSKKKSDKTKKGFDNEMSLDEAESILFG